MSVVKIHFKINTKIYLLNHKLRKFHIIYLCFIDSTYTKKNVMNSEKKTLTFIGSCKFKFHTFLKKETIRWSCTVKTCKCLAKSNNNNCLVENTNE